MSSPLFPSPLSFPLSALSLSSPLSPPSITLSDSASSSAAPKAPRPSPERRRKKRERERDGKSRKLFVPKDVSGGGRQAGGRTDEEGEFHGFDVRKYYQDICAGGITSPAPPAAPWALAAQSCAFALALRRRRRGCPRRRSGRRPPGRKGG